MFKIFNYLLLIVTLLGSTISFAQNKQGNEWITGSGGQRVKFTASAIVTNHNHFINSHFDSGNSSIADSNGNLILASDGYRIYDSTGNVLDGGDTMVSAHLFNHNGTSSYSQSSIFLPIDSNQYYFITTNLADWNLCYSCHFDELLYSKIDMNANGGLGKVVSRKNIIVDSAQFRKTQMTACRHGNGKDWWLVKQEGDSANIHTLLFTKDSVVDKGVQAFAEPVWGPWDIRGQSTFNNDGSMYATTSHGSSTGLIFIADFDRCYGFFSNPRTIQMPSGSQHLPWDTTIMERLSVGLCFSPNNQFLYVVSMSNIYQYDLNDNTWFHVVGLDTTAIEFQDYETAYLGPDSRIYIGNFGGGSAQMSRIDNPDAKGAGCNFCARCLRLDTLGGPAWVGTPPCMPNYGLGAKTCWPMDTNNVNAVSEWSFYPNPVIEDIYIKNAKGKTKILYDTFGKKIIESTSDLIEVSKLSKGLYFLKCDSKVKKVLLE